MPAGPDDNQGPDEPPPCPDVLSVPSKLPGAKAGGRKTLNGLSSSGIDLLPVLPPSRLGTQDRN